MYVFKYILLYVSTYICSYGIPFITTRATFSSNIACFHLYSHSFTSILLLGFILFPSLFKYVF